MERSSGGGGWGHFHVGLVRMLVPKYARKGCVFSCSTHNACCSDLVIKRGMFPVKITATMIGVYNTAFSQKEVYQ